MLQLPTKVTQRRYDWSWAIRPHLWSDMDRLQRRALSAAWRPSPWCPEKTSKNPCHVPAMNSGSVTCWLWASNVCAWKEKISVKQMCVLLCTAHAKRQGNKQIFAMPKTSVKLHTLSSVILHSHQILVMSSPLHQSLKPFATGHAKTHRSIFMVKEIAMWKSNLSASLLWPSCKSARMLLG
jgi:hypothetical protein